MAIDPKLSGGTQWRGASDITYTSSNISVALEKIFGVSGDSMISLDSLTSFVLDSGITESLNLEMTNCVAKIDTQSMGGTHGEGVLDIVALHKIFGDSSLL